jgi:hypothetical protein
VVVTAVTDVGESRRRLLLPLLLLLLLLLLGSESRGKRFANDERTKVSNVCGRHGSGIAQPTYAANCQSQVTLASVVFARARAGNQGQ